jgi:hypothetical protein
LGGVNPCLYPPTIPHHICKKTKLTYGPRALALNATFRKAGLRASALDQRIPECKDLLRDTLKQPRPNFQAGFAKHIEC